MTIPLRAVAFGCALLVSTLAFAQSSVSYRLSFPEPEHRWLRVEVTFAEIQSAPLVVRMSRSSPGRYALHEFAKNVYDVEAIDSNGNTLWVERPDPYSWLIPNHDGTVRLTYKVYGDRVDGTYLAVDTTHAHMNMPATLMWARGLEDRPVSVAVEPPAGSGWQVATQLFPTGDPMVFTAPNLQYLLDSPTEVGGFTLKTFRVPEPTRRGAPPTFRIALHHDGTEQEADRFAGDVEKIVQESRAIFGEFPEYDTGSYTFLSDYLPYASGDGMEHRNSTVLSSPGALRDARQRQRLLGTVSHEFFHCWNVERIRPTSLEPFDFERANMSAELWLAEGFTSYYDGLILHRASLTSLDELARDLGQLVDIVTVSPGRRLRSAVEMSRLAVFVDAARSVDRTNWGNSFISYYTWGAAIGLGLDLTLRDRTDGKVTLDDFMRAMWETHGKPGGHVPGYVANPYTLADARQRLAEVSGDAAFAGEFFDRYIEGREIVDYGPLLARAGLVLRRESREAWLGDARLEFSEGGARVAAPVAFGSPAYAAGLEQDDVLLSLDGEELSMNGLATLAAVRNRHAPGDTIRVTFTRRGIEVTSSLTLVENPHVEIVPIEQTGGAPDAGQRAFRQAWLESKVR